MTKLAIFTLRSGWMQTQPNWVLLLFVNKERTLKLLCTEMMISMFVYQFIWRLLMFEKTSSKLIDSFFAFRFLPNTVFFCIPADETFYAFSSWFMEWVFKHLEISSCKSTQSGPISHQMQLHWTKDGWDWTKTKKSISTKETSINGTSPSLPVPSCFQRNVPSR